MEVITSHTNADFDTLASMVAAKKLYPEARIVFPGSMEKGLRDAVKSFPMPVEIDRLKDIDLSKVTRIILVDISSSARIGPFKELLGRAGLELHVYDHHPARKSDIYPDLKVIEPYGSTTTILTHIIIERDIALSPDEATILMSGIYEDTGSLTFPSTTTKDYGAAAHLLSCGADLKVVSELLDHSLTHDDVRFLNDFIETETTFTVGGTDVVVAAGSVEGYHDDISVLAHKLIEIDSLKTLFLLGDTGDRVHLVARSSLTEVDAGLIADALGGGGHRHAASATLKGVSLIEAREKLVRAIKELVAPRALASEMMSAPPITVCIGDAISEAEKKILRYNVNAVPVIKIEEGKSLLAGIITRQTVSKAVYHGLGKEPVGDYMTTEYETVSPGTSLDEVRAQVFKYGQRLLPVLEEGALVGVITRTDLLKLLQDELIETPTQERPSKKKRKVENLLREMLPRELVELLKDAGEVAEELGFKAYAVGGFVRDVVLRRKNLDIDIVVEGDGKRFASEFGKRHGAKVRCHDRFKTAVVKFSDAPYAGLDIDIATARLEYYEEPGALPTVELSSLKLDLYRRDFTINTLAIELNPQRFGLLIDFFGAQVDIKGKSIRAIHNLSFVEDPTRILRAVRFSERFGFAIAKQTRNLIKNTIKLDIFKSLSGTRLQGELRNILKEEIASPALQRLDELGLLVLIDPHLKWDDSMARLFERARDTLAWYRLLYREEPVDKWLVLFLALTDQLDEIELNALSSRLKMAGKKLCAVLGARPRGREALQMMRRMKGDSAISPSQIYHLLRPLPLEVILYMMEKGDDESVKESISDYITTYQDVETILTGEDLIAFGMVAGPKVGEALDGLLDGRLNGEIVTREDEESFVRDLLEKG